MSLELSKKKNRVYQDLPILPDTPEQMQRTDEWFEQRRGRFTGSRLKELMACDRSTSKMEWGRPEKIIGLGEAAKKYIFEKAMERKRKKIVRTPSSASMRYGTENEDIVKEILKNKMDIEVEEVGFKEFIQSVAGASPDGKIKDEPCGVEIKCTTGWGGLYDRMSKLVDQSHVDFWQIQGEMMALNVDELLYVVAEPSEDIFKPNITDIQTQVVKKSLIHCDAIRKRCLLGDLIIQFYLNGSVFDHAVELGCTNFKIN